MEKKMERMRKEIKGRLMQARAAVACLVILLGVLVSGVLPTHSGNENIADYMEGFQLGVLIGVLLVVLLTLVRYEQALRNDAKLKQVYYKENDERANYIALMAGKRGYNITIFILLIAGIVVGYFSAEAFIALTGAAVVSSLVQLGLKLYYCRTFSGAEE